jgi:homocitrate synthase NifV
MAWKLIDTTLRDGMQAPGVVFSSTERVRIASMLDECGIDEIEAGTPAIGGDERRDISAIVRLGLSCRISAWCRAVKTDVVLAASCGTAGVHISFPLSSVLLGCTGKNEAWLFATCESLVPWATARFPFVSVGAQDATRADPGLLARFAGFACSCGAQRFRVADTAGVATPLGVEKIVRMLVKKNIPSIEFHGHNDLGMASANAVTALMAGAASASVTVNGLGERAGNAALEEVVMALRLSSPGSLPGVRTRLLGPLCDYVAKASGREIYKSKPVTGAAVFAHESGIHCDALLMDPASYQPFLPQQVGRKKITMLAGYHSGASGIKKLLGDMGLSVNRAQAGLLVEQVRRLARKKKRGLSEKELLALVESEPGAKSKLKLK